MSLGWHKQRALSAWFWRKPKAPEPAERSLEEEIEHLRATLGKLRKGGPAHAQVQRQLERACQRQQALALIREEEGLC